MQLLIPQKCVKIRGWSKLFTENCWCKQPDLFFILLPFKVIMIKHDMFWIFIQMDTGLLLTSFSKILT